MARKYPRLNPDFVAVIGDPKKTLKVTHCPKTKPKWRQVELLVGATATVSAASAPTKPLTQPAGVAAGG